jgi:C-1 hydroxylase
MEDGMTRGELQEWMGRRQQAWRARDSSLLASNYAEDAVVVSPIFATIVGRPAIKESFDILFLSFPDWDLVYEDPLLDGNRIALPFSATATHQGDFMGLAGSGKRFQIAGVQIFEMRDGLLVRERRVYDFTSLLIQVGVLRSRPFR